MGHRIWLSWLKNTLQSQYRGLPRRALKRRAARALCVERLEDRVTPASTLSVGNASFNLAAGAAGFTVTRSGDLTPAVDIGYAVTDGTALSGTNYTSTAPTGVLDFASGQTTATIPLTILTNNFAQASRGFSVGLTGVIATFGPPATFAAMRPFTVGTHPFSVVSADLNGDGKPDLIVANNGSNTVSVLLNTTAPGATLTTFAAVETFAVGTGPFSVTTADLNGDGKPDLIVANSGSGTVSVLLNTTLTGATSASFAAQQTFATGSGPVSVTTADLNGDGLADLIVANEGANTLSVLMNTTAPGAATASFAAQQTVALAANSGPRSVTAADVNGDGKRDLLVADYGSASVSVLLNTTVAGAATPTFAAPQTFATGSKPSSVATGDINGDGKPDLIVANYGASTVSVLLNTTATGAATPTFATQVAVPSGVLSGVLTTTAPRSVIIADVNGDGRPDLIVANYNPHTVSVILNMTLPGAVTPTFANQITYVVGNGPFSVTTADINGDGQPDIAVANYTSASVGVLLNTTSHVEATSVGVPAPTFAGPVFTAGAKPIAAVAADLNGDGKPDLIIANYAAGTVSVLLNTTLPGATIPTFALQQSFAVGTHPYSVTVADVNGDGAPDIIVAEAGSNAVAVLLNTTAPGATTPSFATAVAFATGAHPNTVTTADLNGDGKPDVIVTNYGSNTVSVLLNTTTPGAAMPTFATQLTFATGAGPSSVVAADLNGDGRPDLVIANFNDFNPSTVSVLLNTTMAGAATPTFAAQQTFAVGPGSIAVAVADLNGDGKRDLVVANYNNSTVSVLLNTTAAGASTFSFAPQQSFATGANPISVTIADVNGDGRPDLLVANSGSNTVSMLLNTAAVGSATASFAAQQTFATGTRPRSVVAADLNGDGLPDLVVANDGTTAIPSSTVSVLINAPAVVGNSPATGTIFSAPVVQSFALADPNPTSAATVHFTVTFSEAVSGVTAGNFVLTGTGTAGASIGAPVASDGGIIWTVPVTTGAYGTLGLNLNNRTGIVDGNGNQLYDTTSDNGSVFNPVVGPLYTIQAAAVATTTSDNFNTPATIANGAGPLWTTILGTPARFNGAIAPTNATTLNDAVLTGVVQSNVALQADIVAGSVTGQYAGLVARYSGVVSITAATWTAGTATITAVNTFKAGQTVTVTGMTPAGYNGSFTIVSASSTGFTYALASNPGAATAFGAATVNLGETGLYLAGIYNSGNGYQAIISKNVAGTWTQLTAVAVPTGLTTVPGTGTLFFDVTGSSLKLYFGPTGTTAPTLLTYAFDTSLTTGGAGFRVTGSAAQATTLDNFVEAAIPTPIVQNLPFSDNFGTPGTYYTNAGNSAQLNANWVEQAGNFTDASSTAIGNAPANIATLYGANDADVSVQANVTLAVGQYAGVVARYEGAAAPGEAANSGYYTAWLDQYNSTQALVYILRDYQGALTVIGTSVGVASPSGYFANTPGVAATVTLQVEGNSLKAYVNGVLDAYAQDTYVTNGPGSLVPGGSVGMYASAGALVNSFAASDITPAPTVVSATPKSFSLTTPESASQALAGVPFTPSQLNNTLWQEQAGNFTTTGTGATGNAATNIATLYGARNANVSVQANVTLAAGQYAGLVARYEGPTVFGQGANANYYTAWLDQYSSTQALVFILRNYQGALTVIGTSVGVASPSGYFASTPGVVATVTFQVEGDSLKVFVGGKLMAYAEDSSVTNGSVGIYASGGAAISSFSASDITPNPVPVVTATPTTFSLTTPESASQALAGVPFVPSQLNNTLWQEQAGNFTTTATGATGNAATNIATLYGASNANLSVQANVTLAAGQYAGLVARYEGPTVLGQGANANYYTAWLDQYSSTQALVYILRNYQGTLTVIGTSVGVASPSGYFANSPGVAAPLLFQVEGDSLKVFVGGKLMAYAEDSTLTSGSVGVYASANASIGNFSATDITPNPVPVLTTTPTPFNLTTQSAAQTTLGITPSQLDNTKWVEQAGNFTTSAAEGAAGATGNAPTNIADLYGVNSADVNVQATVTLQAGLCAGVVARDEGPTVPGQPANSNYYTALIVQTNSQSAIAYIERNYQGTMTVIASSSSFLNTPGASTLTFQVVGTSLKVYVNDTLEASAVDSTFTSGSVGIFTWARASINNFSASTIPPG